MVVFATSTIPMAYSAGSGWLRAAVQHQSMLYVLCFMYTWTAAGYLATASNVGKRMFPRSCAVARRTHGRSCACGGVDVVESQVSASLV